MRKKKILISLLILTLVLTLTVGLTACDKKEETTTTVKQLTGVKVLGNNEYFIEDFDDIYKLFRVQKIFSDQTTETVALTKDMLKKGTNEDALYFITEDGAQKEEATKSFEINYAGKTATATFTLKHDPEKTQAITGYTFNDKTFEYSQNPKPDEKRYLEVENIPEGASVRYLNNRNTNVGEYSVVARISAPGYKTIEEVRTLKITAQQIEEPQFIVDEENPVPGVLEYSTRQQYVPLDRKNPNYRITGDISKREAGDYQVIVELTNSNYIWKNNKNVDPITMDWKIAKKVIDLDDATWKYSAGLTSSGFFLYQESTTAKYSVTADKYPRELVEVSYVDGEQIGDPKIRYMQNANIPGEYTARAVFKVKSSKIDNYEIKGDPENKGVIRETPWAIRHNRINAEGKIKFANVDEKTGNIVYVYDGKLHKPIIENLNDIIIGAEIVDPSEGFRDVGVYPYTVTITKEGYEPFKLTTTCEIVPRKLEIPKIVNKKLTYNGREQYVQIAGNVPGVIVKGNTYGIEPNQFQLSFALENTNNYRWSDGSTDVIKNEDTNWEICKIDLPSTYFNWTSDTLVYEKGKKQSIKLDTVDENGKEVTGIKVEYTGNNKEDAGTYTVTAKIIPIFNLDMYNGFSSFKTEYNKGIDGVEDHSGTMVINKKPINLDEAGWSKTTFIYKESIGDLRYEVKLVGLPEENPDYLLGYTNNYVDLYTQDGKEVDKNIVLNTSSTDHKRIAKVKFDPNYEIQGFIVDKNNESTIEWEVIENPIVGIEYENTTVPYDPAGYKPVQPKGVGIGPDATVYYYHGLDTNVSEPERKTYNVGEYDQKIIVTKPGFTSRELKIKFKIVPRAIMVPKLSSEAEIGFTFDGTVKNCGVVTDKEKYSIDGSNSAYLPDVYPIKISLNKVFNENGEGVYNYEWQGIPDSHEVIELQWEIKPLELDTNSLKFDYTKPLEYNGQNQEVKLIGVPSGINVIYTTTRVDNKILSDGKAINTGFYNTTAKLETIFKDDNALNEQCYSNIQEILAFSKTQENWEIKPKEVDVSMVRWSINDDKSPAIYEENYKGVPKMHEVKLVNIPEQIKNMFTFEGTFKATMNSVDPYNVVATFVDTDHNFKLVNLKGEAVSNIWKLDWKIIRNDLDWITYDDDDKDASNGILQEKEVKLKSGEDLAFDDIIPTFTVDHDKSTDITDALTKGTDKSNYNLEYLTVDDEGNTYIGGSVTEAGVYRYRIKISVTGYGAKEFMVTLKLNPIAIDKPTVVVGQPTQVTYDGKEHKIEINHNAVTNSQITKPAWAYRIDEAVATSKGTYDVKAILITRNFVWKDGTSNVISLGHTWTIQ